jgi:uncharacterized membrane protein YcfT
MALRTRRKSTCLRTTSMGSVTLTSAGSHICVRSVQPRWVTVAATSGTWEVIPAGDVKVVTVWRRLACPLLVLPALVLPALALPDPAQRRLDRVLARVLRGQVLAVAPGAAGAILVVPLAARNADHGLIVASSGRRGGRESRNR